MSECSRCESLPNAIEGPGTLYLNLPLKHTRAKLLKYCRENNVTHDQDDGVVSIIFLEKDLTASLNTLSAILTPVEVIDTKAFFIPQGKVLTLKDYFTIDSLQNFIHKADNTWLINLIKSKQLTCHFQPIIKISDNSLYAYECLLRGNHDGKVIFPSELFEHAKQSDMLFQMDLAARKVAVLEAAKHKIKHKVFINFTPNAIYDPVFCLRETLKLIDDVKIDRSQIVFEVLETEAITNLNHFKTIIEYYKKTGFKIAIDDLGSGFSSLDLLPVLKPDYIKIAGNLIKNVNKDEFQSIFTKKLITAGKALGIQVLAEGIETDADLEWCKANGVDLGQGYYFSKPANPPVTEKELQGII